MSSHMQIEENDRIQLVSEKRSTNVQLGIMSLFVPLRKGKVSNDAPAPYNTLTLPVNIRMTSLVRCLDACQLPVSMRNLALGNLSGEICLLLATQRSKTNSKSNKTNGKSSMEVPVSVDSILHHDNDNDDPIRSDCLVSTTAFDPKKRLNQEIRVSKDKDFDGLVGIFFPPTYFDKGTTIQEKFIAILLKMGEIVECERNSNNGHSPFRALFNKLFRGTYECKQEEPITIDESIKRKLPREEYYRVLVESQEEFDQQTVESLSAGRSALPARSEEWLKQEQSATWFACQALLSKICKVFVSIIDGNHRVLSAIMSLSGLSYVKEGGLTSLFLDPDRVDLQFAVTVPTVAIAVMQPIGEKGESLRVAIKSVLMYSSQVAKATKETIATHEPIHGMISLVLQCSPGGSLWDKCMNLSEAMSNLLAPFSRDSIDVRSQSFIDATLHRRPFIAMLCIRFFGSKYRPDSNSLLGGSAFFKEVHEGTEDGNLHDAFTALLDPTGESRKKKLVSIHNQGGVKAAITGGRLTTSIGDGGNGNVEGIDLLRNKLFRDTMTSNSLFFLDCYIQSDGTVALLTDILDMHYNGRLHKHVPWDAELMMDLVNLFWKVYEFFTKRGWGDKLGIGSRREREQATAFISSALFADLPFIIAKFLVDIGFDQDELAVMEHHLNFPPSVFPYSRARSFKFLSLVFTKPSARMGEYPEEMVKEAETIQTNFLRSFVDGIDTRERLGKLEKEWKLGKRDPAEVCVLVDLFDVVMKHTPVALEKIREAPEAKRAKLANEESLQEENVDPQQSTQQEQEEDSMDNGANEEVVSVGEQGEDELLAQVEEEEEESEHELQMEESPPRAPSTPPREDQPVESESLGLLDAVPGLDNSSRALLRTMWTNMHHIGSPFVAGIDALREQWDQEQSGANSS